jgi:hypothetical protein
MPLLRGPFVLDISAVGVRPTQEGAYAASRVRGDQPFTRGPPPSVGSGN